MAYDEMVPPSNPDLLERELRAIPGVVSCAVGAESVNVLIDAGVDERAVEASARRVVARHGGPPVHILVPAGLQAPRRVRSRLAVAVVGASAVMAGAVVPLTFRSLPPAPRLQLLQAPEAAAPAATIVSAPVAPAGAVARSAPAPTIRSVGVVIPRTANPFAPAPPVDTDPRQPARPASPDEDCNGHHAYGYYKKSHDDRGRHLGHSCTGQDLR